LDGEIAQEESVGDGREGGTVKRWSGAETEVFTAVKTFYTFKTRSLRARSGFSGKPGESGPNPGYSAPPESSEQIFKEFDFEWIWKIAYVINESLSSINTLD
jgi:hypothetical protein